MSRESRRKRRNAGGPFAGVRARRRATLFKVGAGATLLVLLAVAARSGNAEGAHPTPRAELDHAAHIVPAARYDAYPRVARTYEMVAAVPLIVDGLYCHCDCSEHSDHYSLLDCFASDHGARCDICLSEATIAYTMARDGADLAAIRSAIDDRYGG